MLETKITDALKLDPKTLVTEGKKTAHSSRRTVVKDPSTLASLLNISAPQNHYTSSYIQNIPYTATKIVYQQKEVVQRVPVEKTVIDYKSIRKVTTVPKQKIVMDHYAIEHSIVYVPHVVPQMVIEYVPVIVNSSRLEYVPHRRQTVHFGDSFNHRPDQQFRGMGDTGIGRSYSHHKGMLTSKPQRQPVYPSKQLHYHQDTPQVRQRNSENSKSMTFGNTYPRKMAQSIIFKPGQQEPIKRSRRHKIFQLTTRSRTVHKEPKRFYI